ncbi:MAG TPA: alkaline phosphatase family protein [Candidatus Acidoferrales bacterium]|nr:alkaline phosphatase family protein [Candidatus Acidoferrales bacterium]
MTSGPLSRRQFLLSPASLAAAPAFCRQAPQRTVLLMCDGFGSQYLEASRMPTLAEWRKRGLYRRVQCTMPSVTNTNNASICCGVWPDRHGITGNSYFDRSTGREEYMETADLLLTPTLFQRAQKHGVKSALLSAKKKTTTLLPAGADLVLAAETPPKDWVERLGPAPGIYSREINYWLLTAAIDLLKRRGDLGCLYIHTTDYPMHTWPPEAPESKEHLARLDQLLGEAAGAAPDAAFLLTADHGMNHKTRCWDLEKACARRGHPIRIAISVDRDKYLQHHRGYGGVAWVYCNHPAEIDVIARTLTGLEGVESVLTRSEAVKRYHLMASRIGDLVVLGDRDTVFGELDSEFEALPSEYRAHGSLHEMEVPLMIYNAQRMPAAENFQYNWELARGLYAG